MEDPKPLNPGDACPACGGTLVAAPVPSAEQRRRFEDRELREPYPRGFDTMSENQRAEHGALFRCHDCSYQTRFSLDDGSSAEAAAAGAGRSAPRRGRADKAQ